MEETTQRVDKYLANLGVCSRRNVATLLKEQILTINGKRINVPGVRVNLEEDDIKLNGRNIRHPKLVYFILNKSKGVISTTSDEYGRKNIVSFLPSRERIYPVGRLDKDTTGLILLTNDGELTNLLTHPRYHIEKVYRLKIKGKINSSQRKSLQNGVRLSDGVTSPAIVKIISESDIVSFLEITLHEGKNRQIRRMCEVLQIRLMELKRIKFGPLTLDNLSERKYRELTSKEVETLKNLALSKLPISQTAL
jgi:23S rRNA pseudouridine2605 synthase